MKRIKWIPGLLAGALVLSSMPVPVQAASVDLETGLVAKYTFEESLSNSQGGEAKAVVTGKNIGTDLVAYDGNVTYENGHDGQAVRLGEYGLELNQKNLGENFTVSLWLKPDSQFDKDQSCVFLGYHNPEKWLAVAGNEDGTARFWANGNGYGWKNMGNFEISSDDWHQLTIVGSEDEMVCYLDGVQCGYGAPTNSPLVGENQDIYVGVTYWDKEFTGLVDDVLVYNRALSEAEAYRLYDNTTAASKLLDKTGITVSPTSISMVAGRTQQIEVSMHPVVEAAEPTVTFKSDNEAVATVDADGTVTAVKAGDAIITTTVTLDGVTKTAETQIRVDGSLTSHLVASFDFENSLANGVDGGEAATKLARNLGAYNDEAVYAEGRNGGWAIRLGAYGLQLNTKNIGTDYTVSFWVKNEDLLEGNQVLALLGYHAPENWMALSGDHYKGCEVKFWGNGGAFASHTTVGTTTVPVEQWHQITITGTDGQVSLYRDGVLVSSSISNNPLSGANADIYLGVNNWDALFQGLIDEVKVYDMAMTQEEVQEQAKSDFQAAFEAQVQDALKVTDLLGDNRSADDVRYDLTLPTQAAGFDVTWSSSNSSVISADGAVNSPAQDTEVTLTATFQEGLLSYEIPFTFTVSAFDRSDLNALIAEAKAVETAYLTEASAARLEQAIAGAEAADNTFSAIEEAQARLELALNNLYYKAEAVDPFAFIEEPVSQLSLTAGEEQALFSVPDSIQDFVTVTYTTANDSIARYEDGTVISVANGKTIVTATVTAKYNNFSVEYSTAVEVTGGAEPAPRYTITVTQSEGGTISPETATVTEGNDQTFTITADSGYQLKDVLVDGKSVGAKTTYTFENVTEDHTITAVFEKENGGSTGGGGSSVSSYTITVKQTEGGTITPGTTTVTRGGSKTFTITPDADHEITDVLVDGKSVGAVSTYTFKNVKASHTITAKFGTDIDDDDTPLGDLPFTDVKAGDWFAEAVQYVTDHKLMNGVGSNQFAPNNTMTRAMFVTVLARLEGVDTSTGDTWYEVGREWAMEEGISDGTNMMGNLTREQLATMLYRYVGEPAVIGAITGFSDTASVSDWAEDAMTWAVQNGIISGNGNKLNPQNNATRAEVATMLMRFAEKMA